MRPAWLEIDLSAITHNLSEARRRVGPDVGLIAVVKANAYGHGAVPVARCALAAGARTLAVALLQEAAELRAAEIAEPVLVLGATDADEAAGFLELDVVPTVTDVQFARALSGAAQARGVQAACHVKLDSGMGRQGVRGDEARAFGQALADMPGLRVSGAFSHFAGSRDDGDFTDEQTRAFVAGLSELESGLGHRIPLRHLANSWGILHHPDSWLDAVRPGGLMYGISTRGGWDDLPFLRPAMALKARIVTLKALRRGESVGYSRTFIAPADTRVAVLPVGYADGYPRALSGNADALIRGRRCPVVGRVSMDCVMVDVGGVPDAAVGDEVVLLGRQGAERITAAELAERGGSCVEETVSRMSARLPRVYCGEEGVCQEAQGCP